VTSVEASIVVAYEAAALVNAEVTILTMEKTLVYGKATYLSHYDEIALGDEFVQVVGDGGSIITEKDDISAATALANAYDFTFRNADGEEYVVTLAKDADLQKFGLTLMNYTFVDSAATYPAFVALDSNTGGPSGGLLQTLYIYNMLVEEDVTHGLKIAGTGVIHYNDAGYVNGSVGYIGGVPQKVMTAWFADVDVFFIPYLPDNPYYASSDNYNEAVAVCEEAGIDYEGWLVPVGSFQDVLDWLAAYGD
jgi:PDZ domain-containing protein